MKTALTTTAVAAGLAVASHAFQAPSIVGVNHHRIAGRHSSSTSTTHSTLRLRATTGGGGDNRSSTATKTTDVTITKAVKAPVQNVAATASFRTIDEGIYNFNKAVIDTVYDIICFLYPVTGTERDFARFFVLETVARVPYFAYLSVMHLRETFGERQEFMSERMRTHYAEADNELHHLLIMESLGGNSSIVDRTIAQTMAFGYYWYVVAVYAFSEPAAYHLSELIEDHAYDTYNDYLTKYEDKLKQMPVPAIARKYYIEDNPYMFDQFCTVKDKTEDGTFSARRPKLDSLYDVFVNVRDDEKEHWKTLCNLVQYNDMQGVDSKQVQPTKPATATVSSSS